MYRATSTRSDLANFVGPGRNRKALSDCDWRLATISPRSVASALSILDLASAQNFYGDAACFALGVEEAKQWNVNLPFAGSASLAGDDEARVLLDGFEKGYGEFAVLHDPIGHHRAEHLIDRDPVRDLDFCFVRRTLSHFQIHFGVDGS